jgi:hypothetical protein
LVDTNSLLAIESLFGDGAVDPWAIELACDFTDLFIYADWFRFTFGSPQAIADADWPKAPSIVQRLRHRDSSAVVPLVVPTDEPARLHDDYVAGAFHGFAVWARNNRKSLRQWLDTHDTASIHAMQQAQVARNYYFNLERLVEEPELELLALDLPAHQSEVLYAFDNVLRGPLYGMLAGSDQHYLNHPARNVSLLPTFEAERAPPPKVAVSFKESMAGAIRRLSFDEYCVMLHELRGAVRGRGIHELGPGDVDTEVLRDIAASVSLPPRLRGLGRLALFSGGVIAGLAAIPSPVLGSVTAVAGAAVSVSAGLWAGQLSRSAGRVRWLRWAIGWDLEKQADSRRLAFRRRSRFQH